jgi:acetyltransferase
MINKQLINPGSIVVVGGSNDISKPGGRVLKNIREGSYRGKLYVVNPKESVIQGIPCYSDLTLLPETDMAVIAIAARFIPETVEYLAQTKKTRAFIVISAGFSEESNEGKELEKRLVDAVNSAGAILIGPNCTGVLTPAHQSIFTLPIPKLSPKGCTLVSGSGATACFIMELGIPKGLTFAGVYSVGNSAQTGVEEVVQYMDMSYDPAISSPVILLYIENIRNPRLLLKHASSLIRKGCRIAAIKAGSSEAGIRAASSHTGALASSDLAVDSLFRKAGIIRCYGREELITAASVFMHKPMNGKNLAIISHAGGPAVMLTDTLEKGGMNVPRLHGSVADALKAQLFPGSSVANPIDFLATGTAEQLGLIIDTVDKKFREIDGMAVIFGTPGLNKIFGVYELLDKKMDTCRKPIFPILPSIVTASEEVRSFIDKGRIYFPDEVTFGQALARIYGKELPESEKIRYPEIDVTSIRSTISSSSSGYLPESSLQQLLDAAGIPRINEIVITDEKEVTDACHRIGFPVVMKVCGLLHKSELGGVKLNITGYALALTAFRELISIKGSSGVLIQPMTKGMELFVGAKEDPMFGHLVLSGFGGIFIEVLKDFQAALAPVTQDQALWMIRHLKGYKLLKGVRGRVGADENVFAEIVTRVAALVTAAPEIKEMDLNPLMAYKESIMVVDARIRIEK